MDDLLAAIAAEPDDDEARLVWADRVGGERGELVVIQCRLAARQGTRAERIALRARERELLGARARFAEGDGVAGFGAVTYRRGFVEGVKLALDVLVTRGAELAERAPLLRDVELEKFTTDVSAFGGPYAQEAWAADAARLASGLGALAPGRVKRLKLPSAMYESGDYTDPGEIHYWGDGIVAVVAACDALVALEELEIFDGHLTMAAIPVIARLGLTRLHASVTFGAVGCIELLRAAPALRRFAPWTSDLNGADLAYLLSAPEIGRLIELDLLGNRLEDEDVVRVASASLLGGVERLGLGNATWGWYGADAIASSTHLGRLRDLDLYAYKPVGVAPFLRTRAFTLDTIRLGTPDARDLDALCTAPALERVRHGSLDETDLARLHAAIPDVAYRG